MPANAEYPDAAKIADLAHDFSARWEGGISDDKDDPGGLTMYGVATHFMTAFARTKDGKALCARYGIDVPITRASMKQITRASARDILKKAFFPGLETLHPALAILTYDARLNCGSSRGDKFLQKAARANDPRLAIDGIIGPKTLAACQANTGAVARTAVFHREAYYRDLAASKPAFAKFLRGWLNRTGDLKVYIAPFLEA